MHGGPPPSSPPPAAASARNCPSCSAEVPPNFKFCGSCGTRLDEAPPPPQPQAAPEPTPAPRVGGTLTLIRPDGSEGGSHRLDAGETTVGRDHGEVFESDGYLSPVHAAIVVEGRVARIRDRDSLNGVFVRMTEEEELRDGQIIRIGQELLRFSFIDSPEPMKDGTEVMGSPNPGYWGKLTVVLGDGVEGSAYPILEDSITIGRERGDINFPDDGYVSGLHAKVSLRDSRAYLEDLGSSNGTFLKIAGERELGDDSFVLLGQQLFRLALD